MEIRALFCYVDAGQWLSSPEMKFRWLTKDEDIRVRGDGATDGVAVRLVTRFFPPAIRPQSGRPAHRREERSIDHL